MKRKIIETKELTKYYGTNKVVDNVSLEISTGEILGLIGENGSGKSTILSMINGIVSITSGQILLNGVEYNPQSALEANNNKIYMLVQEVGTINGLTVAENMFIGKENQFVKSGIVNRKEMIEETKKALKLVNMDSVNPNQLVDELTLESRKLIELARALYNEPDILIVDETTAALSHEGREVLFEKIKELVKNNKTVLFVSHDLDEIIETCDRLVILRDGKYIKTFDKKDFNETEIKHAMVGRVIEGDYFRTDYKKEIFNEIVLEASTLNTDILKNVSFNLYKGEILGVGGLSHSGMHDLGEVLFGYKKLVSGNVVINGSLINNVHDAIKNKVGYISKNRDQQSLILEATVKDNLVLPSLDRLEKYGFYITSKSEKDVANEYIDAFGIKCQGGDQFVYELSGGNKQKVAFSKWIANDSKILILDSPTRGVDVGVKTTMYQLITKFKNDGYAILIISEELTELLGMCDRILMMKNGSINKEFIRDEKLNEKDLVEYMI